MDELMIMCFGDSITYGYCADYGKDYVSLFKAKVREDFPEDRITIRNRGVNGESSRNGLARLECELATYSPDLVIMLFGSNDSAYGPWYHVGYEEFSRNYDLIISGVKAAGAQLILITPPPVIEDEEMPFIENSVLEGYCEIIREKAEKNSLKLIDMNKAFKELNLEKGDVVQFEAIVKQNSRGEYTVERPTGVEKISSGEDEEDSGVHTVGDDWDWFEK